MYVQMKKSYDIAAQEDRCSPRIKLTIPAQMRVSGGRGYHTVVQDLSISGFSATSVNRLHPGQVCWLTLPGLESLQAQVIWWEDYVGGCAFEQLLSPIIHEDILRRYCPDALYPGG